jgi:hypothetical protein
MLESNVTCIIPCSRLRIEGDLFKEFNSGGWVACNHYHYEVRAQCYVHCFSTKCLERP